MPGYIILYIFLKELAEKNAVTFSEIGKVKLELNQALNKLEAERKIQTELRDQLSESDRKTSGIYYDQHVS